MDALAGTDRWIRAHPDDAEGGASNRVCWLLLCNFIIRGDGTRGGKARKPGSWKTLVLRIMATTSILPLALHEYSYKASSLGGKRSHLPSLHSALGKPPYCLPVRDDAYQSAPCFGIAMVMLARLTLSAHCTSPRRHLSRTGASPFPSWPTRQALTLTRA